MTPKSGLYGVNMTSNMFHVGDTGIQYDAKCKNGMCTTTFKGFVQEDKATGRVVPDAFDDPIDIDIDIDIGMEVGGTPYNYKPYVWQETYPDNFTDKK